MIDNQTQINFKKLIKQIAKENSNEIVTFDNLINYLNEKATFSTNIYDLISYAKDFMNDNFKTKKSMPNYFLKHDSHLVTFNDLFKIVERN